MCSEPIMITLTAAFMPWTRECLKKKYLMTICLLYDSWCPFNCPLPAAVVCSSKLRIIKPDRSPLSAWRRVVLGPWRKSNLLVLLLMLPTEGIIVLQRHSMCRAATASITMVLMLGGDQGWLQHSLPSCLFCSIYLNLWYNFPTFTFCFEIYNVD